MITTDVHEFDLGLVNVVAENVIARFRLRESGLVCTVPAHFGDLTQFNGCRRIAKQRDQKAHTVLEDCCGNNMSDVRLKN